MNLDHDPDLEVAVEGDLALQEGLEATVQGDQEVVHQENLGVDQDLAEDLAPVLTLLQEVERHQRDPVPGPNPSRALGQDRPAIEAGGW